MPGASALHAGAADVASQGMTWYTPCGQRFVFREKAPAASSKTGLPAWQCTCLYHEPEITTRGSQTRCTRTLQVTPQRGVDTVISMLKLWACEYAEYESKREHQAAQVQGAPKRRRRAAPHPAAASSSAGPVEAALEAEAEAEAEEPSSASSGSSSSPSDSSSAAS
jgi:hypothetical protein